MMSITRSAGVREPRGWLMVVGAVLVTGFMAGTVRADLAFEVNRAVQGAKLGRTQVALCLANVGTGKTLLHVNADEPMVPASNMKLVTTAAALATLGPDFVFRTELRLVEPDAGAAVLLVKGDGDPGLFDPRLLEAHGLEVEHLLASWVKVVQDAGVRRVRRLVIDDRVFDRQYIHPRWPAGQLNSWYCAPVAGVNFYNNCLDVYPAPTQAGHPPRIELVPDVPFVSLVNRAVTGSNDNFLITRRGQSNELVASGHVRTRPTSPIWVTVHDPPTFFGQVLADRLGRAGIAVESVALPEPDERLVDGKLLHVIQTSLGAVLYRCNKDSQNLFAESLLKRCGRAATGSAGSWESGAAAIRAFLAQRLGPAAAAVAISDGSGLSRDNQVTAAILVQLLMHMARDENLGPAYQRSLSAAGQDGTLERRLTDSLSGQVLGKTGYIAGVSTFSGYLVMPQRINGNGDGVAHPQTLAFSMLFNDIAPNISVGQVRSLQDQIVRLIDKEFSGF